MTYKILDCTLRDGGYYNKWNFSLNFVKKYNSVIKKTKIDIVEIGFRKKNELKESKQLFLYTSDNTLQKIKFSKNQLVAVMIDLTDFRSLKDLEYLNTSFPDKKNSKISIIRIACNYEDKILLKPVVQILKKKK
jgi:4-hydroxy 2-oxovalerate aldolase